MTPTALKRLRQWFKKNHAELPWRLIDIESKRDPYAVWISETMLQQTQVSTVKSYFIRWMKQFPTLNALANATEEEVLKCWQGLGYYSRGKNILKTAKILRDKNPTAPSLPQNRKDLEALPGIGAYTAGAILSLAYHQPEAILDGNLVRIFSRFFALDFLPTHKVTGNPSFKGQSPHEVYWNFAKQVANSPKAYLNNEALMELGRTICKIKNPQCNQCPLNSECKAFLENRTQEFPPVKERTQKNWSGIILVVETLDHKILALQGGLPFLKNQFALPHFEYSKNAPKGLPPPAELYVNPEQVLTQTHWGFIKHNITIHKIECKVLHLQLNVNSQTAKAYLQNNLKHLKNPPTFKWIEKHKSLEFFPNSFSLKALKVCSHS